MSRSIKQEQSIVILTGAGISKEAGLPTFRDNDGLWEKYSFEELSSPEAFAANPELVHRFYNSRRQMLLDPTIQPTAAHEALAKLEAQWRGEFLLVTQNVDDLHERAGSRKIIHMHGEILKARNTMTDEVVLCDYDLDPKTTPDLRPHIVWFGEVPFELDRVFAAVETCDYFVAIGTSGHVYPAAGLVSQCPAGAIKIEINLEPSQNSEAFDENYLGRATIEVPKFVDDFLQMAKTH